jgi:hypothetical protein
MHFSSRASFLPLSREAFERCFSCSHFLALIEIFKRTLACACVLTMRLGATFLRLKELVEPAVDLAKEMDCIEAAIFDVICVSVFMRLR